MTYKSSTATPDMKALAGAWIAMHNAEHDSRVYKDNFWAFEMLSEWCKVSPERCWEVIQAIRAMDGSDKILANVAAGPLEDLLVAHGHAYIDKIERLASTDAQFKIMLGGVWSNNISEDVFRRLKRVAGPPL